jgi:hypothetical protein
VNDLPYVHEVVLLRSKQEHGFPVGMVDRFGSVHAKGRRQSALDVQNDDRSLFHSTFIGLIARRDVPGGD